MGLLDYVFRRVVAYEAIRTVSQIQSSGKPNRGTTREKDYRTMILARGPSLSPAFEALRTGSDSKVALELIKNRCAAFLVDLDDNPAPARFAQADTEYRLALTTYISAADVALSGLDGWEQIFDIRLGEGLAHFKSANALMQ